MRCPFCGSEDSQVKDSRPSDENAAIRRRRVCSDCGGRFTTFERVQLRELTVVKRSGRKVLFDRDKLSKSISVALRKRPIEPERARSVERDRHRRVLIDHIGEMGESIGADFDIDIAEQIRIAADEDRATISIQRAAADPRVRFGIPGAASDVGAVEIDGRATAYRCDRARVEKAAVDVAGYVLENDRSAVLGFDFAAAFVRHSGN